MRGKDRLYLQQSFLRMLIEENYAISEEELNNWDAELSLSLQEGNWRCIIVKPEKTDFLATSLLQLEHQCQKAISENNMNAHVFLGSNMDVILLLSCTENNHREIICKLAKSLSRRVKHNVQIGVGHSYRKLSQLHYSKEEAYEALDWGGKQVQIADIRDVHFDQKSSRVGVQAICTKILEQFKNGCFDDLCADLNALAEQVRASTVIQLDAPYPTSIRRTMIELLVELLHIASDAGVDVDTVIGNVDPYRKIFELQGTPAIIRWVVEIGETLSEEMRSRKTRIELIQLEQVKHYIHLHISDMELNLASASQSIGMSPSYFSAFFIREAGVGFKEYVTSERIMLAQKMLKETKDSINTISEKCGFLSPSYFISVFKNQTGMTPGAYRKLKA